MGIEEILALCNDPCRGIEPANANTTTNNDTCQCLSYLGYDWDKIAAMKEAGTI